MKRRPNSTERILVSCPHARGKVSRFHDIPISHRRGFPAEKRLAAVAV
jgi:hypothetical protein